MHSPVCTCVRALLCTIYSHSCEPSVQRNIIIHLLTLNMLHHKKHSNLCVHWIQTCVYTLNFYTYHSFIVVHSVFTVVLCCVQINLKGDILYCLFCTDLPQGWYKLNYFINCTVLFNLYWLIPGVMYINVPSVQYCTVLYCRVLYCTVCCVLIDPRGD